MIKPEKDFCFCTLALRSKYRSLAKKLAGDLEKYAPGKLLIVATDDVNDFNNCKNVSAFKHQQTGILHCYHDKRFEVEKALSRFSVAIQIDADTRIIGSLPETIEVLPGITAGHQANLVKHVEKYNPERLKPLKQIASKLDIPLDKAIYIGESLVFVSRDGGKEKEFIKQWGMIGRYFELKGIHGGEGIILGLAAAKAGLTISRSSSWDRINEVKKHLDASHEKTQKTFWDSLKRKLGYHYNFNRARVAALKDFEFYYR
ncbi:hypothetical protein [Moorena producens]|uniref:hypothetical protein n=1 Tax=Moorena producens TaxID=1155739 RepID=UPI003C70BABA